MKVLHVIQAVPQLYGMERTTLLTLRRLKDRGFEAELAVIHEPETPEDNPVVATAAASDIPVRVWRSHGALDPLLVWKARRDIASAAADLVHAHGLKADVVSALAWLGRPRRVMATVHGWLSRTRTERFYERLDGWALRRMGRVVAHSRDYYARVLNCGVPEERARLIPSGVDADDLPAAGTDMREAWHVPRDAILVGLVGRLSREKGHDVFLEAAALASDEDTGLRYVVVGDGELRESLERRTRELGLADRVRFAGFVENMRDVYHALDVLVSASRLEAMPRVVLEGMATGKPIVATDVGGTSDLIEDGVTGFLVPAENAAAMADRLLGLARGLEMRERFGRAAQAAARRDFSLDARADRLAEIYRELASEGSE